MVLFPTCWFNDNNDSRYLVLVHWLVCFSVVNIQYNKKAPQFLHPPPKVEGRYDFVCLCYLQNRRFFKYIDQSILLFRLFVCQSTTDHNFKPIFMKLDHMVEFVISEKLVGQIGKSIVQFMTKA